MTATVVVIDILGRDGRAGLEHLQEMWKLRVAQNYATTPIYFALSCVPQPASLRYEIRRMGGRSPTFQTCPIVSYPNWRRSRSNLMKRRIHALL